MEVNPNYSIPNITVYNKYCDGEHYAFKVVPNDGYVMYDSTANNIELDPDTMEEISVIYYYRSSDIPLRSENYINVWVAVLETEVDENYIFGVGDNNHEVM